MRIQDIKKDIKAITIKYGVINLVLTCIVLGAYFINDTYLQKLKKSEREIAELKNQYNYRKEKYESAYEDLDYFIRIEKNDFPSNNGLNENYLRIRPLVIAIEQLKKNYYFKDLDFTLGEIEQGTTLKVEGSNIKSYESVIFIQYSGLTEHYIYSFIKDLSKMLDGMVNIREFEIEKLADVTNENLIRYVTDDNFTFTKGKMALIWTTLENKN